MTHMSINDQKHEQALLNQKFHEACKMGDVEQVSYLLESPELTLHANIHSDNDLGLRLASTFKQVRVIDYILSSSLFVPPSFHSKYSVLEKAQEQVMEYIVSREEKKSSPGVLPSHETSTEIPPEPTSGNQMNAQSFFQPHASQQFG